jgi:hypothetical protein
MTLDFKHQLHSLLLAIRQKGLQLISANTPPKQAYFYYTACFKTQNYLLLPHSPLLPSRHCLPGSTANPDRPPLHGPLQILPQQPRPCPMQQRRYRPLLSPD